MSKLIEVTSQYRNRNQFPNPSQFEVYLGQHTGLVDGVYEGVVSYPPPNQEHSTTFGYIYGASLNGGASSSELIFGILPVTSSTSGKFNTITPLMNYVGKYLELVSNTVSSTTTDIHEYRKIIEATIDGYQTITHTVSSTDITENAITLDTGYCDLDNVLNGFEIEFTTASDSNLLGVSRTIDYYRGYDGRVYFNTPITEATITAGDTVTIRIPLYKIRLEEPFSIGELPSLDNNCMVSDHSVFRIRDGIPIDEGTISSPTSTTVTLEPNTIDSTGKMLWITSDPVVFSGSLASGGHIDVGGDQVQGTFTLTGAASFADDYFNGMTINITSGNFNNHSYVISDWDNATQTGTVTPGWTSLAAGTTNPVATDTFTITAPTPNQYVLIRSHNTTTQVATLSKPVYYTLWDGTKVQYTLTTSDTYDILSFSHENYHPLDYSQSLVAQQQAVCYEVELLNLTLPNLELKTGGRISNYPYVYVQFESSQTNSHQIYSNNPNARKCLFRTPIIFNYRPEIQKFVPFLGHGMKQFIKFKINDSFKFSVYLPNGELFETIESDYFSPSESNPNVQISALFSFKLC